MKYSVNYLTGCWAITSLLNGQKTNNRAVPLKPCYNGFLVSALEKPTRLYETSTPAIPAGYVLVEAFSLMPDDLVNIHPATQRAISLDRRQDIDVISRVETDRADGKLIKNEFQLYQRQRIGRLALLYSNLKRHLSSVG